MMEIDDSNDTSGIVKTEQNIMMMCIVVDIRNAMITIVVMVRMMVFDGFNVKYCV